MSSSTIVITNQTANTKSANLLSGDINEFIADGGNVTIYAVASAAGLKLSLNADTDVVIDDKEIVAIGTTLNNTDHYVDSFLVGPRTRLSLTARETAGVSTTDAQIKIVVE